MRSYREPPERVHRIFNAGGHWQAAAAGPGTGVTGPTNRAAARWAACPRHWPKRRPTTRCGPLPAVSLSFLPSEEVHRPKPWLNYPAAAAKAMRPLARANRATHRVTSVCFAFCHLTRSTSLSLSLSLSLFNLAGFLSTSLLLSSNHFFPSLFQLRPRSSSPRFLVPFYPSISMYPSLSLSLSLCLRSVGNHMVVEARSHLRFRNVAGFFCACASRRVLINFS